MEKIRNLSNTFIFKALTVILALSFASWGVSSQIFGASQNNAITVNGEHIHIQEVQKAYFAQKQRLKTLMDGKEVPIELEKQFQLGDRTVNRVIIEKLLQNKAKELNLDASPKAIRDNLRSTQAFLDENGQFSREIYKSMLNRIGSTENMYEANMKEQYNIQNVSNLFTSFIDDETFLNSLMEHDGKLLDVQYIVLNPNKGHKKTAVSEEEIKDYYDTHQETYTTPESRHFNVLTITAKDMMNKTTVSHDEVVAYYEKNKKDFNLPERRQVQHILLKDMDAAKEAKARLDAGESFEALVAELSVDYLSKGNKGDLGLSTEEELFPAVADAAFNLKIGEISEPVTSDLGVHIVKISHIADPEERTLEDDAVNENIQDILKQNKAEELYFSTIETLEKGIRTGTDLRTLAEQTGQAIERFEDIKEDATSITVSGRFKDAAFALEEGDVSPALEAEGAEALSFVQVTKIIPQAQQDLAEVSQDIEKVLRQNKLKAYTQERAENYLTQATHTHSLNKIAIQEKAIIERAHKVSRTGKNAPKWLQRFHLNNIFNLKEGEVLSYPVTTGESFAILRVQKHLDKKWTDAEKEIFINAFNKKRASELENQYVTYLLDTAKIDMNKTLLTSVLGESFTQK